MSDVSERHAQGTPAWVDLAVPDVPAAASFYGAVFGWEYTAPPGDLGGYQVALVRGRQAAGIAPLDGAGPAAWTTYLATDDLDATLDAARRAGGVPRGPVFDVGDQGRGALMLDPTGAVVGLWQGGAHIGAGVVNEAGALCWNELATPDAATAAAFYRAALGVEVADAGFGFDYSTVNVAGRVVAGLYDASEALPDGDSARWVVYFQGSDTDVAVAAAVNAGGSVVKPAQDTPFGRTAHLSDPWGAEFAVITPNPERATG